MNHEPQRRRVAEIFFWILCVSASLRPVPAFAQYEAPPFDSIHLAVPEISSARDWYLKNIGGNVGETADRVAFGRWSGDHPLPLQLIFDVSSSATPSAGSVVDSIGFSYVDLDAKVRDLQAAGVKILVLSHLIPADDPEVTEQMWTEQARIHFRGSVIVGKDLLEI